KPIWSQTSPWFTERKIRPSCELITSWSPSIGLTAKLEPPLNGQSAPGLSPWNRPKVRLANSPEVGSNSGPKPFVGLTEKKSVGDGTPLGVRWVPQHGHW